MAAIDEMRAFDLIESEIFINKCLDEDMPILAEGAQGSMLDIDFGTYPFVTSSNTLSSGVCTGLGVAPNRVGKAMGIFKAYCTRVGSGPFPTELNDETGEKLRQIGHEFGATTGRPRRTGWLDLVALKYAVMMNGVTELIMMKADVLNDFDTIKVATGYELDGKNIDYFPFESGERIKPVYREVDVEGEEDVYPGSELDDAALLAGCNLHPGLGIVDYAACESAGNLLEKDLLAVWRAEQRASVLVFER